MLKLQNEKEITILERFCFTNYRYCGKIYCLYSVERVVLTAHKAQYTKRKQNNTNHSKKNTQKHLIGLEKTQMVTNRQHARKDLLKLTCKRSATVLESAFIDIGTHVPNPRNTNDLNSQTNKKWYGLIHRTMHL